ncbi:hypothetical protein AB1P65_15000 [Roseibium alexandrii]
MPGSIDFFVMKAVFTQQFWNGDYLVRRPIGEWQQKAHSTFDTALSDNDNTILAAAANSFALLLVKCRQTADAKSLCQSQKRAFLRTDPELAVQPHINLGRIAARQGRWEEARRHFFWQDKGLSQNRVLVDRQTVILESSASLDVCTTVCLTEGTGAYFNELRKNGNSLEPAFRALQEFEPVKPALVAETTAWLAFHTNEEKRLAGAIDNLVQLGGDPLRVLFLQTLQALKRKDMDSVLRTVLVLASCLDGQTDQLPRLASLLISIRTLMTENRIAPDQVRMIGRLPAVRSALQKLNDCEISAAFQGETFMYKANPEEQEHLDQTLDHMLRTFRTMQEPRRAMA